MSFNIYKKNLQHTLFLVSYNITFILVFRTPILRQKTLLDIFVLILIGSYWFVSLISSAHYARLFNTFSD